jgi:murein DD-endopeptidase MepM/ murein hydrolase activator NlpD
MTTKQRYYHFDPISYNYVAVTGKKRNILRNILFSIAGALVLGIVWLNLSWIMYGNVEEIFFRQKQEQILSQLTHQSKKLIAIEQKLNKLHETDQTFYRSILNKVPIDPSVWNGGTGGHVEFAENMPPVVKQLASLKNKISYKVKIQQESYSETYSIALNKSAELTHIPAIKPIPGRVVSGFGYRADPFHGHGHFHAGLDIVADIGTPIKSVADGVVITSGAPEQGYGLQVEINHGFGYVTKYAHLSGLKAQVGQKVKRGDIIGYTGNTGYSTGPHLHYEVIKNGEKVNPMNYIYGE